MAEREKESSCYYFFAGFVIFYYSTGTLTARLYRRPVRGGGSWCAQRIQSWEHASGSDHGGSNRSPAAV